jgi:AcrR family transcriptional regulator
LVIISQNGLQSLGVTSLSKKTGISKSLILYHYPSVEKIIEDLYLFSGKLGLLNTLECLKEAQSFEEKISAMLKGIVRWVVFHREVGEFFTLMFHEASKSQEMQDIKANIFDTAQKLWERIFLESMRYNDLQEFKYLTKGVNDLITGAMIDLLAKRDTENYRQHLTILIFNLERFLQIKLPPLQL